MDANTELLGTLTGQNVTELQRWSSAWGDLLAADMALLERGQLDDSKPSNAFLRRALWESAIASYGRCAVSARKRKIAFNDFVRETTGDDGMAVHERIMDWRHGQVAHRNSAEFESSETVLTFAQGPAHPTSLNLVLSTDTGPANNAEFVIAFQGHVKTVRDAIWEKKLFPIAVAVIDDLNAGRITRPTELRIAAQDRPLPQRLVINQCITTLGAGGPIE